MHIRPLMYLKVRIYFYLLKLIQRIFFYLQEVTQEGPNQLASTSIVTRALRVNRHMNSIR